jgi:hypothetical protein
MRPMMQIVAADGEKHASNHQDKGARVKKSFSNGETVTQDPGSVHPGSASLVA